MGWGANVALWAVLGAALAMLGLGRVAPLSPDLDLGEIAFAVKGRSGDARFLGLLRFKPSGSPDTYHCCGQPDCQRLRKQAGGWTSGGWAKAVGRLPRGRLRQAPAGPCQLGATSGD